MKLLGLALSLTLLASLAIAPAAYSADVDPPWVVLEGKEGAGKGKHIVLISGDQDLLVLAGQPTFLIEAAEAYRRRISGIR